MKTTFYYFLCSFFSFNIFGQGVDFEEFEIPVDSFINNAGASGAFSSMEISFPNAFNEEFSAWSGWAISSDTDTTTEGFTNQYSSIVGSGADQSQNFAVSFVSGQSSIINTAEAGLQFKSLQITNGTYPYLSMLNGDAFAKKFGGETGDDPDFFLLTIKGMVGDEFLPDSIDFYLADYRFEDNSQDYIVDSWENIDLRVLEQATELVFTLSSSDVGQFGMNTPAYFCIDNLDLEFVLSDDDVSFIEEFTVFPNPSIDRIILPHLENPAQIMIFNIEGREVLRSSYDHTINVSHLPSSKYVIMVNDRSGKIIAKTSFIKSY